MLNVSINVKRRQKRWVFLVHKKSSPKNWFGGGGVTTKSVQTPVKWYLIFKIQCIDTIIRAQIRGLQLTVNQSKMAVSSSELAV